MAREKLPDRRPSITKKIPVAMDSQSSVTILITVGFADDAMTQPREVFCANWKTGTALHAIVMDSCVLMSRLLQHGDSPRALADTLCRPPSLIGAIAAAVAEMSP